MLRQLITDLHASVKNLSSTGRYQLVFYKGTISPKHVDTGKSDLIAQALQNAPDSIHSFADITLDLNNDLLLIDSIDSSIKDKISPIVKTVQEYTVYFLSIFNLKPGKEKKND
jgi:hypothetical protein